jgi:hypothetical protein
MHHRNAYVPSFPSVQVLLIGLELHQIDDLKDNVSVTRTRGDILKLLQQ